MKGPTLEVRLVTEAPSADSDAMMLTNKQQNGSPTQEVVHVKRTLLLSQAAVRAVWVWKRGEVVGIDITLTDAAKTQLAELTRQNVGKRLAIVIDGRLRSAPKIMDEIDNGSFTVTSDWTLAEVQQLADRFEAAGAERGK